MARLIGDRLAGTEGDPDMVQPQPKASLVSLALRVATLCVCEVISAEDNAECGKGEATRFIHW
ncbi:MULTISPECIES: hypothetical protein [Microvirga]|uniref:hypothetical protein n=1 Tax=Microvirga TaxID=186650 RepID=UPI001CFF4D62|nr:hypothetical protein [Microvirga lenta]MCB5174384.1 hypothetical protein [Microvirga lenta]